MKKILLIIILIGLLIGSLAILRILDKNYTKSEESTITKTEEAPLENKKIDPIPSSGTDSINSLVALNQNMECSISYEVKESASAPTVGTLFTSQNRMRSDFLIPELGNDAVSSIILKNGDLYSWTEINGMKNGMKTSVTELSNIKENNNAPRPNEVVPLDALINYECKPWKVVDGSIFEPPTDVIFANYSDAINAGMEYGTIYKEE